MSKIKNTLRSGLRIAETTKVLTATGLGWLRGNRLPAPKLLRQTFEELGATYIKLGQFIASSPSLFPADYVREFEGCLDAVTPVPYSVIYKTISEQLDRPVEEVFSNIETKPLASASIAQVHAARLATGQDVVIKVQKPGVDTVLVTDFNFLYVATRVMELLVPAMKRASLSPIVGDIQKTMLEECDFLNEANNIDLFNDFLQSSGNTGVVVPKVYREASAAKILTMERFYGVPLTDLDSIRKYTPAPELTLVMTMNTWFQSLMDCQLFHADLHAGNVMVLTDGRVGFIDFGIVGHIKRETWSALVNFLQAQQTQDYRVMAESMVTIGATAEEVNIDKLTNDIKRLIASLDRVDPEAVFDGHIDESEMNEMMLAMVELGKSHGIRFPREFALLVKQFLYFDRYVQLLAPEMSMFDDDRIQLLH